MICGKDYEVKLHQIVYNCVERFILYQLSKVKPCIYKNHFTNQTPFLLRKSYL